MENIQKYYNNTENNPPSKNIVKFINLKTPQGKAIELGCGAGRDTIYLIKNNWNVLAIDREDVEDRIKSRLDKQEYLKRFRFQKQDFENLVLVDCDVDLYHYHLIRSTMGAIFSCNVVKYDNLDNYINDYNDNSFYSIDKVSSNKFVN